MRSARKRVLLAIAAFLALLGVGGSVYAAAQKADFSVTVSPSSASVGAISTAMYSVSVVGSNGFKSPVTLSLAGLPTGATGTFAPNPNSGGTSSLSIQTSASTPTGNYVLTITGVSGSSTHSVTTSLIVTAPPSKFSLSVSPATVNAPAGTVATYAVTVTRTNFASSIAFSVSGTPAGASATFTPTSTTGNTTSLQISTSAATTLGSYALTITGVSGTASTSTTAQLSVSASQGGNPFTISGTLDRLLAPGVTGSLNLALTNPNNQSLNVTNLTVSITGTDKPGCATGSNYSVVQFGGVYPLTVPANSTRNLSQLVSPSAFPKIVMNNLSTNQDACKGAKLSLSYSGTGQGG